MSEGEREREGEGEGGSGGEREAELLGATGYLSCYNGVSYEKTSVNFLSDLQQSRTQSSHSAPPLKSLSDREPPLFPAPRTHKPQLWSH